MYASVVLYFEHGIPFKVEGSSRRGTTDQRAGRTLREPPPPPLGFRLIGCHIRRAWPKNVEEVAKGDCLVTACKPPENRAGPNLNSWLVTGPRAVTGISPLLNVAQLAWPQPLSCSPQRPRKPTTESLHQLSASQPTRKLPSQSVSLLASVLYSPIMNI